MLVLEGQGNGEGHPSWGGHPSPGLLRGAGLNLPSQEAMWRAEHWHGGVSWGTQLEGGCGPRCAVPVLSCGLMSSLDCPSDTLLPCASPITSSKGELCLHRVSPYRYAFSLEASSP